MMVSAYDDLEPPKVWLAGWCKEHKGPSLMLYVPIDATNFTVSSGSTASITFRRIV
jgi:hypothetical protein